MIKIKTSEIRKELENKGIKYSQYNARIKWVADRLEIKPIGKIKKEWAYTKTDASKIIKWISRGYNGKRGKKPKQIMKASYKENQWLINWEQAYKLAENQLLKANSRIVELERENIELKEKLEKKRKFWFFK